LWCGAACSIISNDQLRRQIGNAPRAALWRPGGVFVALEFRRLRDPLLVAAPIEERADCGDLALAARQAVAALAILDKGLPFGGADRSEHALAEFGIDLAQGGNLAMAYWPAPRSPEVAITRNRGRDRRLDAVDDFVTGLALDRGAEGLGVVAVFDGGRKLCTLADAAAISRDPLSSADVPVTVALDDGEARRAARRSLSMAMSAARSAWYSASVQSGLRPMW
jgi:hypothetical protein